MTLDEVLQRNAELGAQVRHLQDELKLAQLAVDKLKLEVTYLRRMKYGRSSERLEHPQLELVGGEVVVTAPPEPAGNVASLDEHRRKRVHRPRPNLRELPAHLPRRTLMHWPVGHTAGCGCAACGLALREIGQDISEVLDYEPGSFHVVRHVRPKLVCGSCKTITQASAPSRPIDRAHFSDRGRLFQADRERRFSAIVDARGVRASEGFNVSQSSTISLKRGVDGPLSVRP